MATLSLSNDTTYNLYINSSNLTDDNFTLVCNSLHNNTLLFNASLVLEESNDRYTHFTFDTDVDLDNDISGMYEMSVFQDDIIIDKFIIKIVNNNNILQPEPFKSTNERREAISVFRPKY